MIRIAIVEDEEAYVQQLISYLHEYQKTANEEIAVTVYRDGDEITSKYKSQYDIILMDIQMRFMDGMTAVRKIREMLIDCNVCRKIHIMLKVFEDQEK